MQRLSNETHAASKKSEVYVTLRLSSTEENDFIFFFGKVVVKVFTNTLNKRCEPRAPLISTYFGLKVVVFFDQSQCHSSL